VTGTSRCPRPEKWLKSSSARTKVRPQPIPAGFELAAAEQIQPIFATTATARSRSASA
jgi:hypothetical protein